jgi:hypothetical protein
VHGVRERGSAGRAILDHAGFVVGNHVSFDADIEAKRDDSRKDM